MTTPLWYFDEALDDAYSSTDWLAEAMASNPISDADLWNGITTVHLQDGILEHDTNVFCEFIDIDGVHGFGTIQSWHQNPYDVYGIGSDEDYAYILTDEGATYAFIGSISPLHETIEVNNEPTLQSVLHPVADTSNGISAPYHAVLQQPAMPAATHNSILEASA